MFNGSDSMANNSGLNSSLDASFSNIAEAIRRIALIESQLRILSQTLQAFYIQGRLRTDRVVPTSSADVQAQDAIYDRVLSPTFEYILVNNAGTLAWRRITLNAF